MIRCIAVDDEKKALEVIALYAERVDQLDLQATFTDPVEASLYLENHSVDLLFLDINMKGLNGFELLETLTHRPEVIFTTAYSEYAVDSYRVDALDYLVKPIPFSRFLKAVNKLKSEEPSSGEASTEQATKIVSIKSGTAIHRVKLSDVLFVEADGNYSKYHTTSGMIMALGTLKEAMTKLDGDFMQVHRSYIVALRHVEKVESHQLQINGKSIPVSSSFRKAVMEVFG
jgi:DNA-binding LytR/AlgR family response regulator